MEILINVLIKFGKLIFTILISLIAVLEPTIPFAIILFIAILMDCMSAFDLSRRLKKQHPDNSQIVGKFQSRYALRMLVTFIQAFSVVVLLHYVDYVILHHINKLYLSNWAAAIFCGIQIWSILENLSSANGARWAKIAQKIMVDKSKRHFGIELQTEEEKQVRQDYENHGG